MSVAVDRLNQLVAVFRHLPGEESGEWRSIRPTDTYQVIADTAVCARVYAAALPHLQRAPGWKSMQAEGYSYSIFRFGDYYAMEITLHEPGHDMSGNLVFEVRDLKYLTTMVP